MNHRDWKYFENDLFRADLLSEFSKANIEEKENGLNNLLNACKRILNMFTQAEVRKGRSSRGFFISNEVSKGLTLKMI